MTAPGKSDLVAIAQLPWEEALLLVGRLQADGIAARVFPESKASPISEAQFLPVGAEMAGEIGLGRHFFQVLVPRNRVKDARRIVDEINKR
jgi:hypothetical protein